MIRQTKAGTWEVDHYYFDNEGKRRRKLRTFDTHRQAVAYAKESAAQVLKNEFVAPNRITVKDKAEAWFHAKFSNGNYARASRIERESHVHRYIVPSFGALPIQNLNVAGIEKAMVEWNKTISAETANKIVRTLAEIMDMAKRHKDIRDNPAKEAKRLKQEDKAITPEKVFTREELRRVIEATSPATMERIVIMTLALTGARIGEVCGASWDALDLKTGKLHIRTTMSDPDKGKPVVFKKPKNNQSIRTVDLSKELVHEFKVWRLKCPPSERNLMIVNDAGLPVRRRAVSTFLRRILRKAAIDKKLSAHSFRHTFASLLLADKVPVPEVSHRLGHKSPKVTMAVYAHFIPTEGKDTIENFSQSILGDVSNDVSTASSNAS